MTTQEMIDRLIEYAIEDWGNGHTAISISDAFDFIAGFAYENGVEFSREEAVARWRERWNIEEAQ